MLEFVIVIALVLWSAVVVFKKVFPKTANSVFLYLSDACRKQGWQSLANWLKPAVTTRVRTINQNRISIASVCLHHIVFSRAAQSSIRNLHYLSSR